MIHYSPVALQWLRSQFEQFSVIQPFRTLNGYSICGSVTPQTQSVRKRSLWAWRHTMLIWVYNLEQLSNLFFNNLSVSCWFMSSQMLLHPSPECLGWFLQFVIIFYFIFIKIEIHLYKTKSQIKTNHFNLDIDSISNQLFDLLCDFLCMIQTEVRRFEGSERRGDRFFCLSQWSQQWEYIIQLPLSVEFEDSLFRPGCLHRTERRNREKMWSPSSSI